VRRSGFLGSAPPPPRIRRDAFRAAGEEQRAKAAEWFLQELATYLQSSRSRPRTIARLQAPSPADANRGHCEYQGMKEVDDLAS
jgi:hypothetical protein